MIELGREILGEPPEEISFGYVDLKEFLETASITNLVPATSAILLASSDSGFDRRSHRYQRVDPGKIKELEQTELTEIYGTIDSSVRGDIRIGKSSRHETTITPKLQLGFEELRGLVQYQHQPSRGGLIASGSPQRIDSVMRFWDGFDPDLDGIREIRISISTEQAEEMFDFDKIQNLISSDEITTRSDSVERLNQPYSDLQPAVKNEEALDEIIHTRLEQAGIDTEGISEKLRIRWGDRVGGKGSLEVYQTQTLDPLLPALIENLVRHSFDEPPQWYYPGEYSLCQDGSTKTLDADLAPLLSVDYLDEEPQSPEYLDSGTIQVRRNEITVHEDNQTVRIRRYPSLTPATLAGLHSIRGRPRYASRDFTNLTGQLSLFADLRGIDDLSDGIKFTVPPADRASLNIRMGRKNREEQLASLIQMYLQLHLPESIASGIESETITIDTPAIDTEVRESIQALEIGFPRSYELLSRLASGAPLRDDFELIEETEDFIEETTDEEEIDLPEQQTLDSSAKEEWYSERAYEVWRTFEKSFEDRSRHRRQEDGFRIIVKSPLRALLDQVRQEFFQ